MEAASGMMAVLSIIIGFLVIFISIVWLVFPFLMMSRLKAIREELEKGNQVSASILGELRKGGPAVPVAPGSTAALVARKGGAGPAAPGRELNVSRNGRELGTMDIADVKSMVQDGSLSKKEDYYFDPEFNQWVALECHPEFC